VPFAVRCTDNDQSTEPRVGVVWCGPRRGLGHGSHRSARWSARGVGNHQHAVRVIAAALDAVAGKLRHRLSLLRSASLAPTWIWRGATARPHTSPNLSPLHASVVSPGTTWAGAHGETDRGVLGSANRRATSRMTCALGWCPAAASSITPPRPKAGSWGGRRLRDRAVLSSALVRSACAVSRRASRIRALHRATAFDEVIFWDFRGGDVWSSWPHKMRAYD
jgi:hypothetical protein